jgi:hypothetical protein
VYKYTKVEGVFLSAAAQKCLPRMEISMAIISAVIKRNPQIITITTRKARKRHVEGHHMGKVTSVVN